MQPDITITDYHALPNIGSSFLKAFIRSPLHAWSAYLDPEREQVDKLAFRIGRAWHCAVFEPHVFDERYAADHTEHKNTTRARLLAEHLSGDLAMSSIIGIPDDLPKTTKAGKQLYAEAEALGHFPVPASERDLIAAEAARIGRRDILPAARIADVQRMASIARALPISLALFEQLAHLGRAEVSILDADPATGVPIKIRPDYLVEPCEQFPNGLIVDGKSAADASREGFGRAVWAYDYGLQAAFYTAVAQRALGTKGRPAFVWLAQEKTRPYAAQYFGAGDALLEHWDARIAELMPSVAECLSTGIWPGYPTTVEPLELPAWAQRQIEAAEPDVEVRL